MQVWAIALDPQNPRKLYVGTSPLGIFNSDENETSRREAKLKSAILTKHNAEGMLAGNAIAVSPAAPSTPFVAVRMGLYRSDENGSHSQGLRMRVQSPITFLCDIRPGPHAQATLYATLSAAASGATDSIWRSRDGGVAWQRIDSGPTPNGTMMGVAPSPRAAGVLYGATQRGEVYGTLDGGQHWYAAPLPGGCKAVMAFAVS
jgi:hypothetical protein